MKNKLFIGILCCFTTSISSAESIETNVAKYMLKKQQPISKQVELQYQLLESDKHKDKIISSNPMMPASEYVVDRAFTKLKVPVSKTAKLLSQLAPSAGSQYQQQCFYPHSPETMLLMTPVKKIPTAEIATINSTLDVYLPLYDGLLENMRLFAEEKGVTRGKSSGTGRLQASGGLTKAEYVNFSWNCTKSSIPGMPSTANRFYPHLAAQSVARASQFKFSKDELKAMDIAQVELLERIFNFYNSHPEYYRQIIMSGQFNVAELLAEVKEFKIDDSNFDDLENSTAPETSSEEFSIDDLDI